MKKRKYPLSLFIVGFITNMLFRFFLLFVSGVILLVVGFFIKPCLKIGLLLLILDIVLSFIEQLQIRKAMLEESDNPEFSQFQDMISQEGSWIKNVQEFVEEKIDSDES